MTDKKAPTKGSILSSALLMSVITMGSRFLGLIREQVRAHYLGTSFASDAFGIAFQIPNLLRRLVAEGAMTSGFIPIFAQTKAEEGDEAAWRFTRRFFNLQIWVLALIVTLGIIFREEIVSGFAAIGGRDPEPELALLTGELLGLMFPYIAFVSFAAVIQGILNSYQIFWVSASTSILLNLSVIIAALIGGELYGEPVYAMAIGVVVGGLLQFITQLPWARRVGFRWQPDFKAGPAVRKALALLGPTTLGVGVYQLNVLISQAIAWGIGDGAVSSLQYSSRLLELTLGIFSVALSTAVLPALSRYVAERDESQIRDILAMGVRLSWFVCIPVTVGMSLVSIETIRILFERGSFTVDSTVLTASALNFHILGLLFISLTRIYLPCYYAFKDTWTPLWSALVSMLVNVGGCYLLAPSMGAPGIALANSISAVAQLVVLRLLLRKHLDVSTDRLTIKSALLSVGCGGLAGAGVWSLQNHFGTQSVTGFVELSLIYGVMLVVGGALYFGAALLCRHPELAQLREIIQRRRRR